MYLSSVNFLIYWNGISNNWWIQFTLYCFISFNIFDFLFSGMEIKCNVLQFLYEMNIIINIQFFHHFWYLRPRRQCYAARFEFVLISSIDVNCAPVKQIINIVFTIINIVFFSIIFLREAIVKHHCKLSCVYRNVMFGWIHFRSDLTTFFPRFPNVIWTTAWSHTFPFKFRLDCLSEINEKENFVSFFYKKIKSRYLQFIYEFGNAILSD